MNEFQSKSKNETFRCCCTNIFRNIVSSEAVREGLPSS
jgi:hypothetical protein